MILTALFYCTMPIYSAELKAISSLALLFYSYEQLCK
ncbi:MAG: hypothetical protein ACI9C9_001191, partial [Marivirga sp.]